uniref:Uncharacterized protein n=1 Tax=Arundo donax TaxID=35708 RepID=A0A0A9G105_ARUDO
MALLQEEANAVAVVGGDAVDQSSVVADVNASLILLMQNVLRMPHKCCIFVIRPLE